MTSTHPAVSISLSTDLVAASSTPKEAAGAMYET
jgi:hypothetical protein